jgi:ubiquinone/menaquinone biosynthesis C-methylase UbiE
MVKKAKKSEPLRLDLGCGPSKKEGFYGVDSRKFPGVDLVFDLTKKWPWKDGSVDEVHCSHMVEHLTWPQRVHFFNEMWRVMKADAKATVITPHWASNRFYGDPTHQAPFSEFAYFYLNREWRKANAPHTDYTCNFEASWGFSVHPALQGRSTEYVNEALQWYKEAAQDLMATLVAKV